MKRSITFEQACAKYQHRFTMQHVPQWANNPCTTKEAPNYYAPQYASDREWYEITIFPGEGYLSKREKYCHSAGQTWPLGNWLAQPYEGLKLCKN